MRRLFTEHPSTVNETYGEHLLHAAGFGTRMILAGIACMLHALLPFLFVHTGSRAIAQLHEAMIRNRSSSRGSLGRERIAADPAGRLGTRI